VKGTRVSALVTGLAAALVLAGCGVPPSGVIQAGDPATGMTPGVNVYFLSGGSLVAVPRQIPFGAGVSTAVRLLFEGPLVPEAGKLSTELPQLKLAPEVAVETDGTVVIRLFEGVAPFGKIGMEQLVCTVAAAPRRAPPPAVPTSVPTSAQTADAATPTPTPTISTRQGLAAGRPRVLVIGDGWHLSAQQDVPCPAA